MKRFSLACLAVGLLALGSGSAKAEEITQAISSDGGLFRTAELRTTDADVAVEPVRRGRYYRSYGPSYRRYSYYPRYSYRPYGYSYYPSYRYYGYGSYPRSYGYSYGYGYPRYYSGYRSYGYPGYYGGYGGYGGGVYIGRGGISIGW